MEKIKIKVNFKADFKVYKAPHSIYSKNSTDQLQSKETYLLQTVSLSSANAGTTSYSSVST